MSTHELEKKIAALEAQAKEYQEHAGALMKDVADLREELKNKKEQESNFWLPNFGGSYYMIFTGSNVEILNRCWNDDEYDNCAAKIGNVFRTKEEAEFAIERLKVLAEMKKFSFQPDWANQTQKRWSLYYDTYSESLRYCRVTVCSFGVPIFESEERVRECIAAIGEERILKYYFGINS